MLVHLPIGAWIAAAVWDAAALWTGQPLWWQMAYWSLILGLSAFVPAAGAGFVDYLSIPSDTEPERTASYHLTAVAGAAVAYLASVLVRGGSGPPATPGLAVGLDAIGLVFLIVGGWLGGELVYRHHLGVEDDANRIGE